MLRLLIVKGVLVGLVLSVLISSNALSGEQSSVADSSLGKSAGRADETSVLSAFGKLPLLFEENHGQALGAVSHVARGPGYQIQLAPTEAIVSLARAGSGTPGGKITRRHVRMQFVGANRRAGAQGVDRQPTITNYFQGDREDEHLREVPNFARVKYAGVYPGVDLVYHGNQENLEFDLIVAPAADPNAVRLRFDGADDVRVRADGALLLQTDLGQLELQPPYVYQDTPSGRSRVSARFVLESNIASVRVAQYDRSRALVIDPVLTYSATVGGIRGADSEGISIAVDSAGQAYVAGWTTANDFPTTNGVYDRSMGTSDTDIFVVKLNAAGTALVYSTYLGGRTGIDFATGIAIDGAGNAYVTGRTSVGDFPTTPGAYQSGNAAGGSFIAKLTPSGNTLTYSTYLLNARTRGIAVDGNGNAVVVGDAASSFATTTGAFQTVSGNPSGRTGFVLKLNAAGSARVYSTFLGGSAEDQARAVSLDAQGAAYVAGSASSANFPLQGALQSIPGGRQDGFIAKLNAAGSSLEYSTLLGGAWDDWVSAIAVDTSGNAYVAGTTGSTNFPVLNAFKQTKGGRITGIVWYNAFVTKVSANGGSLLFSSYLGGDACLTSCSSFGADRGDQALGIAVNASGNAFVAGVAESGNFPAIDSVLTPSFNRKYPFVVKVSTTGSALLYSTLLSDEATEGGIPADGGVFGAVAALATDSAGNVYGTGNTKQPDQFPTTTVLGASYFGSATIFKLSTPPPVSMTLASSAPSVEYGPNVTLTATPRNPDGTTPTGSILFYRGNTAIGSATITNGAATLSTSLPIGVHRLLAVYSASGTEGVSPVVYQLVNSPAECPP